MATRFQGDSSIDSQNVIDAIEELEGELRFEVYRVRNEEVLESFGDEDEAQSFIEDEDYDPDRVKVRQGGLDEDQERELAELRELNEEGRSNFDSWSYGITVTRESSVDAEEYARGYLENGYNTRGNDLFRLVEDYVDFERLGENLLEDAEGGDLEGYVYIYV